MIRTYEESGQTFYEVRVFVKDRYRRQISRKVRGITSEAKARKIEFDVKTELLSIASGTCSWTWGQWHEECLRKMKLSVRAATVMQYDGRLKRWIPKEWESKKLSDFTQTDIHTVIHDDRLTNDLSTTSKRTVLKLIRRIFGMAVEEGVLERNPTAGLNVIAVAKEQDVLNAVEAQTLLDQARITDHRFYPIWSVALMSGMRSGEMYALRWIDMDFVTGFISVRRQWTNKDGICPPKWGSSRTVPISETFKKWLLEYRMRTKGFTKTLRDSNTGQDVTFDDYVLPELKEWQNGEQAQVLRDFCRVIQIQPVRFHDLRATFITNLLTQGVPLVQVMAIVGHRKMATTDKYLRKAGIDLKGATDALGYKAPEERSAEVLKFPG